MHFGASHSYSLSPSGPGVSAFPDHTELRTANAVRGVYVDGVPELITCKLKEWADIANVEPVRLPGYWIHDHSTDTAIVTGQKPDEKEKVLYFLHGGAYIGLSAHPDCPVTNTVKGLVDSGVRRSFGIEYRLTTIDGYPPANPFPTQLIDALAGYAYLVRSVGFDPANIIVVGDSAGGNLALALTRYLVEYSSSLPIGIPGGLLLLSPWSDLSGSNTRPGSSAYTNAGVDYLAKHDEIREDDAPRAFVAPHTPRFAWTNAYISPACNELSSSFKGFPRTFIVAGDSELLYDQIKVLYGRMVADLGSESVGYYEGKDSVHDYLSFLWHEPQRSETIEVIKHWMQGL